MLQLLNLYLMDLHKQLPTLTWVEVGGVFLILLPVLLLLNLLACKFFPVKQFMLTEFSLKHLLMPPPTQTELWGLVMLGLARRMIVRAREQRKFYVMPGQVMFHRLREQLHFGLRN